MTRSSHSGLPCRLFSGGWWLRLFAVVLFVYGANYGRVHLALEVHQDDVPSPARAPAMAGVAATLTGDPHTNHDGHVAHLACDHSLRLVRQTQTSYVPLDFLLTATGVEVVPSRPHGSLFLTQRQNPPERPPPDPLQPRAPPLA